MLASVALVLGTLAASELATPDEVSALLDRLGDADLVLTTHPGTTRPVRVLLATRVAARVEQVRQVLSSPASYVKAMPSFRRVEVLSRREHGAAPSDLEVAWELEVPLWNLQGRLWLRPRPDGVDLELAQGDFAPGLFHLTARPQPGREQERSILSVEGHANLRNASLAARKLVQRSPLAEPGMTVAAAYVMLKSLAGLAETGGFARPHAALGTPELANLDGLPIGRALQDCPRGATLLAAVRCRGGGRLDRIEVGLTASAQVAKTVAGGLAPEIFTVLPGWKKVTVAADRPEVCTDPVAPCWAVKTDLPLFSLDGTWKPRPRPWRAHMVAGQREGAIMGIDVVPLGSPARVGVVLSEHPRLDRAGYLARKLIAAEPYLEHGLALALTIVDAVSLVPALDRP